MPTLSITGLGLLLDEIRVNNVRNVIAENRTKTSETHASDKEAKQRQKQVATQLAREDRTLLNSSTVQCLLSAIDCFNQAESENELPLESRQNFGVFTSTERDAEFPIELWNFIQARRSEGAVTVESIVENLGQLTSKTHPLGLFRKLPTNSLYHISKLFQCRGGGYPINRMSLSGLSMLEEAFYKIRSRQLSGAILSAYGNMKSTDNQIAFRKMGLVSEQDDQPGIVPANGAASILVEQTEQALARGAKPLAHIQRVCTTFHSEMYASERDWLRFYDRYFSDLSGKAPIVILYDNGALDSGDHERSAINKFFGSSQVHGYKKFTGYTGQPNNLIDLVFAISDPAIPSGQPIVLNGVGISTGMGALLFEKTQHTNTDMFKVSDNE